MSSRISLTQECAVAAVVGLYVGDVGIGGDAAQGLGLHADEGIVGGVNDQGRHCDSVDQVGGRGARVVVVGSGETAVVGGDAVIELAQAGDSTQARDIKLGGEESRLESKPPEQLHQEII